MTRAVLVAVAVAVAVGGAACGTSASEVAWKQRRADDVARCDAEPANGSSCVRAGDTYAYDSEPERARAAYVRGCAAGHVPACARQASTGDHDGDYHGCMLGAFDHCAKWLGWHAGLDDPRRDGAIARACEPSADDCAELFTNIPRRASDAAWGLRICQAGRSEACTILARLSWEDASVNFSVRTAACEAGGAEHCWSLADRSLESRHPAEVARAEALLHRACTLGHAKACETERDRTARERQLEALAAACRQGKQDACVQLGRAAANREP